MTPPTHRRSMTPARRASLLLLVFGCLAAFAGVAFIAAAPSLAQSTPPQMKEQFDELRRRVPFDLQIVAVIVGVMTLLYGVTAVTLGILVRNAGRATAIVTLVLAALMTAWMGIQAGAAVVLGSGADAVFAAGIAFAHGMIVKWMIQTLKRSSPAAMTPGMPERQPPLADYYLPPVAPG